MSGSKARGTDRLKYSHQSDISLTWGGMIHSAGWCGTFHSEVFLYANIEVKLFSLVLQLCVAITQIGPF